MSALSASHSPVNWLGNSSASLLAGNKTGKLKSLSLSKWSMNQFRRIIGIFGSQSHGVLHCLWCLCPFQMEYQQRLCLGWGQRHEITLGSSLSFLHHFWHKTDPACMLSSQLWAIISWVWAKPKLKPNHEKREKQEKTPYSF